MVVILALAGGCWWYANEQGDWYHWTIGLLLLSATLYQFYRILPYTSIWAKSSIGLPRDRAELRLMVSNVLQTNDKSELLINLVRREQPDLLLTVETNEWWEKQLDEALGEDYPHAVRVPLDNLYGMHLYSRMELEDPQVTYRVKDDIPGIETTIQLASGKEIDLYFVHPMPPSPTEAYASTSRDAELIMVGKKVKEAGRTAIVAGDLNDVAWSHSTRLFRKISGLSDPRLGRGLYSTFHADHWWARWPLDHIFHSHDLGVGRLQRLESIGSDHFPILIELGLLEKDVAPIKSSVQEEEKQEAEHKMRLGQRGETATLLVG
ncbi:endonuclease/exonuclease/phosphatase family protein [Lewinella sp. W8]|uniref:endonuclease/exonuclease/phosphatase family protein n=1 Tax=Lewinella sp. W8 TaxID=2528208 RepID=UPI0010673C2B|nr:endonuclease/exonuclease/phosphatase family protein [Lewinella sp. W8]MTB50294.1 endonuclease [Lewinella sp. W8]